MLSVYRVPIKLIGLKTSLHDYQILWVYHIGAFIIQIGLGMYYDVVQHNRSYR